MSLSPGENRKVLIVYQKQIILKSVTILFMFLKQ